MQLLRIFLWPKHPALSPRIIRFETGKVNVIVGASATGKSSLWPIVDYCLGSSELRVPIGVARDQVAWFGALFQTRQSGELFIARQIEHSPSARAIFMDAGPALDIPSRLSGNCTLKELKAFLNSKLTQFPETPWGKVISRDMSILNIRAQYMLANPTALLFDVSRTSSFHKIRFALPRLLKEDAPAELAKVRVERDAAARMGELLRRSTETLRTRLFDIYVAAQNLNLVARNRMPQTKWDLHKVVFELGHALRLNKSVREAMEQIAKGTDNTLTEMDLSALDVATEHSSRFGSEFASEYPPTRTPTDTAPAINLAHLSGDKELVALAARLFALGRMQECLAQMECVLEDMSSTRQQWMALGIRLREMHQRGARYYVGLTEAIQRYAGLMQLSFCEERVVLEEETLSLMFLLPDQVKVGLAGIGGFRNYAGYGIALLLAIHEAIDKHGGLGVNQFLFIDEMSQAFSGNSDNDESPTVPGGPLDSALDALNAACSFMQGRFQVILLESDTQREAVQRQSSRVHLVEDWDGQHTGLIPNHWGGFQ